jgi:uncharacterized protein involved in response to NO
MKMIIAALLTAVSLSSVASNEVAPENSTDWSLWVLYAFIPAMFIALKGVRRNEENMKAMRKDEPKQ